MCSRNGGGKHSTLILKSENSIFCRLPEENGMFELVWTNTSSNKGGEGAAAVMVATKEEILIIRQVNQ